MTSDDRESPLIPPPPSQPSPALVDRPQFQQHPFFDDLDAATPRSIFVPVLIVINILVFVAMILSGVNFIMPDAESTIPWGVDFWPLTTNGQWWRLLTSAFVHFGIFHIAFNMWALYAVGKFTERLFGNFFFLLIYLFCAVLSGITSIWFEQRAVAAGASGAIFAIYGALLAYLVLQRAAFPQGSVQKLMRSALSFVAINIVFGFSVTGISNGAHIGGLVTGFILGAVFARPLDRVRRKQQTLPKLIAGMAVGAAMIGAGIAFIPKAPPDVLVDRNFLSAIESISPLQQKLDADAEKLLARHNDGQLTDKELAERLEQDIVPKWSQIADRLAAIPVNPDSSEREHYDYAVHYAQLSRDGFRALDAALRNDDPQKLQEFAFLRKAKAELVRQKRESQSKPDGGN